MNEKLDERMLRVVQYLEGELDALERAAFERELESDRNLVNELEAARKTLAGLHTLGEERLRKRLQEINVELNVATRKSSKSWWWAAATLVVMGSVWWMMHRDTPQQLAKEFDFVEIGLPVLMGSASNMDAIMNAYKQDDITTADHLLNASLALDPTNDTLHYFAGIVAARSQKCNEARMHSDLVPVSSRFYGQTHFQTALCALRSGEVLIAREQLGEVLNGSDIQLATKARALLERLNDL